MRARVAAALLGLLLLLPASHPTVRDNDPQLALEKGTVLYRGVPFTGRVLGRTVRLTCRDGLRDGLCEAWYADGQLESRRPYRTGLREGVHEGWWPDGKLRYRYRFCHDVSEGVSEEWFATGQLYRRMTYSHGQEDGQQTIYRSDGRLEANYQVIGGERFGLVNTRLCHSKKLILP